MNYVYLVVLSLIGFIVSFCIYYSKRYGKPMHCIIGQDCDAVVKSRYGKTLGMENGTLGMLYYALIFVYAIFMALNRNVFKGNVVYYSIVSASIGSVLFSAYLTAVQAFVLKKWCEYCIVSSIASYIDIVGVNF